MSTCDRGYGRRVCLFERKLRVSGRVQPAVVYESARESCERRACAIGMCGNDGGGAGA